MSDRPTPTRKIARQATSAVARIGLPPQPNDPLLAFTPVPHKAARRNSITAGRQRAFIAHLAATGIVTQAAMHIGASMEALYKLRHIADKSTILLQEESTPLQRQPSKKPLCMRGRPSLP